MESRAGVWILFQVFWEATGPCKQENGVISLIFSSTVILGVGLMEKQLDRRDWFRGCCRGPGKRLWVEGKASRSVSCCDGTSGFNTLGSPLGCRNSPATGAQTAKVGSLAALESGCLRWRLVLLRPWGECPRLSPGLWGWLAILGVPWLWTQHPVSASISPWHSPVFTRLSSYKDTSHMAVCPPSPPPVTSS